MTESYPTVDLTQPSPNKEPEGYFDQNKTKTESSISGENEDGTISQEPKAREDMLMDVPQKSERNCANNDDAGDNDSSDVTSSTISEQGSGYERKSNECTEFCIDLAGCFGLFDSCCPSTGEGFITDFGVFCGNLLVGCCHC